MEPTRTNTSPYSGAGQSTAQGKSEAVQQVAQTAGAQAQEVSSAAVESTKEVAGTAKEQVRHVASEATTQMGNVVDQAKDQLHQQAQTQTDKIAETLGRMREQAHALASGRPEEAGPMADYARQAVDRLAQLEQHVSNRGFDGLVEDTKRFARRRPGVFLLGAAAAGFGIGRLLRNGAASAVTDGTSDAQPQSLSYSPTPMAAGTGLPMPGSIPPEAGTTPVDQTVAMPQPVFYENGTSSPAMSTSLPGS